MPDHKQFEELLPAYVLDILDELESAQVTQHLAECSACQSALDEYEKVAADLSLAGPEFEPPPGVKGRLFDRLPAVPSSTVSSTQTVQRRMTPGMLTAWGLVSLILIVALTVGSLFLWQRINRLEQAYRPGGMFAFSLFGTEVLPEAAGYLIAGADGLNGAIIVDKLPTLDPGKEYQLWLVRDQEYTSGALIAVDEMGYGGRRVNAPGNLLTYSAASITIEPEGGSPNPTGKTVLVGALTTP